MNGVSLPKLGLQDIVQLLRNKNYIKLWSGLLLAQSAINMLHFVLIIHLFELTGSSFLVGSLIAVLSLAPILFSSLAGVLSDSVDRRSIITVANAIRAILTLLIFFTLSLPILTLVLAFLITIIVQFLPPAESASIPDLVEPDKLTAANAFYTLTFYGSFLIGYSLAGPALEHLSGLGAFAVIFVLFSSAALIQLRLPPLRQHLTQAGRKFKLSLSGLWQRFTEGLTFVKSRTVFFLVFLQVGAIFAIERGIIALTPAAAHDLLQLSISEISFYLITPLGIGCVIGVILVNHLKTKFSNLSLIRTGLLLDAIAILMFPLFFWLGLSSELKLVTRFYMGTLTFLSGLADVLIIVSAQTYLQEKSPAGNRGRVFGSLFTVMNLVGLPVILLMGWFEDYFSITEILAVCGLVILLLYFVSLFFKDRVERDLPVANEAG